jgi:hypothetical protein
MVQLNFKNETKSRDADRRASINPNTTNLFARHPLGPLQEATIHKLIN